MDFKGEILGYSTTTRFEIQQRKLKIFEEKGECNERKEAVVNSSESTVLFSWKASRN